MHLIDPQDPYTMVAIDPAALGIFADAIITAKMGDEWKSTEYMQEHVAQHDEPGVVGDCIHCRIRRFHEHGGLGYAVAKAQYAYSILV